MQNELKKRPQLNTLQEFEFVKTRLMAGNVTTGKMIALRPCVENLGLDWSSALKRIKRDEDVTQLWSSEKAVAEDGKAREMVCLPPAAFQDWLWGLDPEASPNFKKPVWEHYKKGLVVHLLMMLQVSMEEVQRLQQIEVHYKMIKTEVTHYLAKEGEVRDSTEVLREKKKSLAESKSRLVESITQDANQLVFTFPENTESEEVEEEDGKLIQLNN